MPEEYDDVIDRIVGELKALPPVPPDATARVLARIEAARRSGSSAGDDGDDIIQFPVPADELVASPAAPGRPSPVVALPAPGAAERRGNGPRGRRLILTLPAAIGWALAATLAGFLIRGAVPGSRVDAPRVAVDTRPADVPAGTTAVPVANPGRAVMDELPVPVQFVLDAPGASRVALVGDFNGWDTRTDTLTRDPASGLWSAVVSMPPGRHVYAYLVDGSVWTLDPNAPRTTDADYGTEQSVLIVGTR